jgi:hypothetical protein
MLCVGSIPNHAHFLFRTGKVPLATVMRRLPTGYAVSFNRRHKRVGHLFQNRYKSIVCQEDVYLRELVRYIHLNPVRAGIVATLSDLNGYVYCGHSALMGRRKRQWQDVEYVLSYFGESRRRAQKEYLSHLEAGFNQGRRDELKQQRKVKSRSLFCYRALRELGISQTELAKRLKLSVPAIGYSVDRGESIAHENGYDLVERLT